MRAYLNNWCPSVICTLARAVLICKIGQVSSRSVPTLSLHLSFHLLWALLHAASCQMGYFIIELKSRLRGDCVVNMNQATACYTETVARIM